MYGQRTSGGWLGRIILLGVLIGVGFVIYDQLLRDDVPDLPASPEAPAFEPTAADFTQATNVPDAGQPVVAEATVAPVATLPGAVDIGEASLLIPRTGAIAPITQVYLDGQSWDVSNLGMNIGHLQGTSWVTGTAPGNIVLSGHVELSDGRRGIFAGLDEMQIGETIILTRNGADHYYRVVDMMTVAPDDLTPVYPTQDERLTLITCTGYDFFSDTYEERQVVVAERVYDAN